MASEPASTSALPSSGPSAPPLPTSTFSFKAPFPAIPLKHRRVSLALPNSPRVVPAFNFRDDTGLESHVAETSTALGGDDKRGKFRMIHDGDGGGDDGSSSLLAEKKARKKWSPEETKMLVDGCNKHGVGNWKTILSDPEFQFDNRSPVDLKDRFRTYYPDAYKQHYPNARTHLSNKVRSTLPDGTSLFEKTRSKKRRPFTEEEDRALKAGYDKHGTLWATIVKDPIFQEQGRRSTDLRDRFRNAFPDLYTAAGYKPRGGAKKVKSVVRAATDDQIPTGMAQQQRKKRRYTSQGLLRGGTKSVPQSANPSDDEASDDEGAGPSTERRPRPASTVPFSNSIFGDDDEMDLIPFDPVSMSLSSSQSEVDAQSQTWSSGVDTPVHSSHHAWTGSPTSSTNMSDFMMTSSPSRNDSTAVIGGMGMIGKSAWGTSDWFSPNPRLDSSGSSSFADSGFSPSSPFSFNQLSHGVVDRYDLVPSSFPQDFNSEVGSSGFSDEIYPPRREYHSDYAGDLIFGTRTQSQQSAFDFESFGMHTPALPGIDEIELTGITISDQQEKDNGQEGDGEASFLLEQQRFNLDDLVDLSHELHSTPPATPQTRPRRMQSLHGRSISVPPAERMIPPVAGSSRPGQMHANSQPDIRGYSAYAPPSFSQSFSSLFLTSTASPTADGADPTLPFLDLHYYGMNMMAAGMEMGEGVDRGGQALDLAGQGRGVGGSAVPGTKPGVGRERHHQRGQSAVVNPQDLMRSDTNKRKRASWDGAHP
ncbi:hypothetical protein CPB85DRAFT_1457627 [Mucidula mucida]|nr:hypothetical protein CPB85DRAFT_1457627 [Mucidula mucida]